MDNERKKFLKKFAIIDKVVGRVGHFQIYQKSISTDERRITAYLARARIDV